MNRSKTVYITEYNLGEGDQALDNMSRGVMSVSGKVI